MPEGDTVWRAANTLRAALEGRQLTTCDIRVPRYATVDFTGETVDSVASRGKHLLIRVGGYSIHSHLKMEGTWHVYAPGARWRRPAFQARIILNTADAQAIGFELGVLEILEDEDDAVGYLGPDLLGPDWDPDVALSRLAADPARPIGLALLDQRNIAGLGNVYRNEICFLRGVDPRTPVGEAGDLSKTIDLSYRLIMANKDRNQRVTTGDRRPGRHFWVYGRENKPCRRCGTTIEFGLIGDNPLEERQIYHCPHCQKRGVAR
ncbi:Fpg/Nei family DNA glycosylase [Rhodococcus sp. 06-418-5]|jgi:endonuclease-8|uniref:DNA-formamidopyrimidine glycosylase family protein n=1 Tax=Nocardiaceae TaxID=85025 RepID=UPI00050CC11B|nr:MULTISPECIES: DNA-formamidopyrimidine glycosylase family protein [Rhodococcus]AJW39772.1 Formamidopyrimidine-DNA glycosylase [Rhodococcus sp. B7740]OZC57207.1 Fpg/Nei family DNA glycosylase [Rhodococcus sp. 06-470-2]OZC75768.1 Fpg/Nei family DNA glycosylase [Rhodococcus sp. 06-418-5]OZD75976.1 Fpg/Nei family DNA glycosylase [Rhodococcus sp. 05-339-2]OZE10292.1 Fpg/Nei family DNA glycosylase [Rhodococcus sp. 05-2255-3C]